MNEYQRENALLLAESETSTRLWRELGEEASRLVPWIARRWTTNVDAEDVVQDALLRAWTNGRRLAAHPQPKAWLRRVARNGAIDLLRREGARGRLHRRWKEHADVGIPTGESDAPARRGGVCLHDALRRLPTSHRSLLEEIDLAGVSIASAAIARGITANNARVRLHRARRALRDLLKSCDERSCAAPCECGCDGRQRPVAVDRAAYCAQ